MQKFLSDVIGEKYKDWRATDVIFLSTPTGGGKTTFICKNLLSYAAANGKYILFLVNRKILLEQIKEALSYEFSIVRNHMIIMTYQSLEDTLKRNENFNNCFDYIVCDEAHYFFLDSLFNTNTFLSYNWVRNQHNKSVLIYMSATIEQLYGKMKMEKEIVGSHILECFDLKVETRALNYDQNSRNNFEFYSSKPDYSFLDISVIDSIDFLFDNMVESTEKWLIFVESIPYGERLMNKINSIEDSNGNTEHAVFLSANFKNDPDSEAEVEYIAYQKKQYSKILISTSVMDNGISLIDYSLRNIVIMSDVREEFIQMIGRKRYDGGKVKLYLVNKSLDSIERRLLHYKSLMDICDMYTRITNKMRQDINLLFSTNEPSPIESNINVKGHSIGLYNNLNISDDFSYINDDNIFDQDKICSKSETTVAKSVTAVEDEVKNIEKSVIRFFHNYALRRLVNDKDMSILKLFYLSEEGFLIMNPLSVIRTEYLALYYKQLRDWMLVDDYALPKMQLSWLGYDSESVNSLVESEQKNIYLKSWEIVNECFLKCVNLDFEKNEFLKVKNSINAALLVLVKSKIHEDIVGGGVVERCLKKNERPLSDKNVLWLKKHCDLKFRLDVITKKRTKKEKDLGIPPIPTIYRLSLEE